MISEGVENVTGTVENDEFDLAAGVVGAYATAATGTATLNLSGEITEAENNKTIGNLTVTIAKKAS